MKQIRKVLNDPRQAKFFGIIWWNQEAPSNRLRAGDVIRLGNRLCRVIRVNDCAAVVIMNRPARVFMTRFDKPVKFELPPALFRISPNAEVEILNRGSLDVAGRRGK